MSKLMGRKKVESGFFDENEAVSAMIRYDKTDDFFVVKMKRLGDEDVSVHIKGNVLLAMCEVDSEKLGVFDAWSIGYISRVLIDDDKEIKRRELDFVWKRVGDGDGLEEENADSRISLLRRGWIDNDSDYMWVCIVQYLFRLGKCSLVDAKRQWKRCKWGKSSTRWVELERRVERSVESETGREDGDGDGDEKEEEKK